MIGAMLVWESSLKESGRVLHILEERAGAKNIKSTELTVMSYNMKWKDPNTTGDTLTRDWMVLPKEYST